MRSYTTLPLVIGVASASQQFLPWHSAAQINEIVSHKAAKTRKVADTLERHLEDVSSLFDDFNITDIFGDDFDDFDFEDFCGDVNEVMGFGNVQCTCALQSGDLVLTDMATIIENWNVIMENGVDLGFDCLTLSPECYGNECGKVDVTCNMTLDFTMQEKTSMGCYTCVEYTNDDDDDYPEGGVMEGQTLCMSLELCLPEMAMEPENDNVMLDVSEILCGCNATLNGNECSCSLCDDDVFQGIELDCGDYTSTCTDTGFEMQNNGTTTSVANATAFLPKFQKATAATGDSTTTSAATFIATPFVMSGLILALALT